MFPPCGACSLPATPVRTRRAISSFCGGDQPHTSALSLKSSTHLAAGYAGSAPENVRIVAAVIIMLSFIFTFTLLIKIRLCTLTGAPCESVSLQAGGGGGGPGSAPLEQIDKDLVWAQLLSSRQACFLMGASCGGGNMKCLSAGHGGRESVSLQAGGGGGGPGSAPLEQIDKDLVWAQLLSSRQACFLMGASCGGGNMKCLSAGHDGRESVSLQAGGGGGGPGSAPLEQIDKDLVWAQLLSSRQACFLMGASCGGGNMKVDEDEYQRLGLRPRHAYSVLDVVEVEGPRRLLRLRNPWGHYTWRGAWAHGCPRWTDALRRAVQEQTSAPAADTDHGVFWISFEDVLKYFDCIDICKVRVGWHEVRLAGILPPMSSTRHLTCLLLTATQPTEVDFTLFQEGQRNSAKSQRSQLDLCVAVFRAKSGAAAQVGKLVAHSKRQVRGFVGCHKMLEKGFYLVVCLAFNHWHTGLELGDSSAWPRHVLAAHSSKPLVVERPSLHPHILADAIIGLTLARGQRHEGRQGMTAYYLTKGWAGLVVMVENRHNDKWIHVKCDCQESYNVVSTRGELKTVDSVPPLHRQVIIVLTQLEGSGGFSIAHRLTHRLAHGARLQDWAPPCELEPRHRPPLARRVLGLHAPRVIT
ncbi:unnamed protein product [Plutella xylostella]|uniref:(diamondback moth) hypothetical protein n=1 Tax=Plutella xylostella TaxID=51655 RepID=A0A8S4G0H6_PLUXY|nr:unnamed protein product [Plutella xylostella]